MDIEIILPHGAQGARDEDSPLEFMLREIAVKASDNPNMDWAEKYGTDISNDTFIMHRFCWCDQSDCPYCYYAWSILDEKPREEPPPNPEFIERYGMTEDAGAPNFWYKPLDFKVWWYKYIGRDMETNMDITMQQLTDMWTDCLKSLIPKVNNGE